jgi:hypothetical protein
MTFSLENMITLQRSSTMKMYLKISVFCNIKPASVAGSVVFYSCNTYRKKVISESGKLEVYFNCKIKI